MAVFKPNKRGLDQFRRELQREFDARPVRVPVVVDGDEPTRDVPTVVNNYHGPVVTVHGDRAQLALNNGSAIQVQGDIAAGYTELAKVITDLLAELDQLGLPEDDATTVREEAQAVLAEVTKENPDDRVIKRGVTLMKGALAAVGAGLSKAVTAETAQRAAVIIDTLGQALG
ncbi:hypothetical protein [Myceligenerans xiligouense]|uniref:Uncharacterized protein n=1 Tax=Myceligenerans xiligouense TaxID=253184 RepID=A0A3N4YNP6_9MICO|nr:hypothetical protein [Myceligenerans xiligouense]RPF21076.1 hypothetical protein EDD34_1694 [Myceligenerans xiligouense]